MFKNLLKFPFIFQHTHPDKRNSNSVTNLKSQRKFSINTSHPFVLFSRPRVWGFLPRLRHKKLSLFLTFSRPNPAPPPGAPRPTPMCWSSSGLCPTKRQWRSSAPGRPMHLWATGPIPSAVLYTPVPANQTGVRSCRTLGISQESFPDPE